MTMNQETYKYFREQLVAFLHIFVRYNFPGGENEREGAYLGIVRLALGFGGYSNDVEREWVE
jgi:hypothetical protein